MFRQHTGRVTFGVTFDAGTPSIRSQHDFQKREIVPTTGEIEFYPQRVDGTGPIAYSVKVSGPMVKADGTPGKAWATYDFSPGIYRHVADFPIVKAMYHAFCDAAEDAIRGGQRIDI
jgi:hypothetical protein